MTVLSILYSSGFSVDDLSHILKKDVCQERNFKESDGRLTVDKLYSMRVDADLVTLSACETGLGKVDDVATSHLMTEFYEALKKSGKRESLRKARLSTKKKYPHPYYWASFQLTGNSE
jgi:CHAT domain-containing protein